MGITFEAYLATAIFTSVLVGIIGSFLIALLVFLLDVPGLITFRGNIPTDIAATINEFQGIIFCLGPSSLE